MRTKIPKRLWELIDKIARDELSKEQKKQAVHKLNKVPNKKKIKLLIDVYRRIIKAQKECNFTRFNHWCRTFEELPIVWATEKTEHIFTDFKKDIMLLVPQEGMQFNALSMNIPVYELGTNRVLRVNNHSKWLGMGSGAGVGKTWTNLASTIKFLPIKNYSQIMVRAQHRDLYGASGSGGVWKDALKLYEPLINSGDVFVKKGSIEYSDGSTFMLDYISEDNMLSHQGNEYSHVLAEEICQIDKAPFFYLTSRNRFPYSNNAVARQLALISATCNPEPHHFLKDMLEQGEYLAPNGTIRPSMDGKKTFFVATGESFDFDEKQDVLQARHPEKTKNDRYKKSALSFTFLTGSLDDNRYLADTDYRDSLSALPIEQQQALLMGSWNLIKNENALFDFDNFNRNRLFPEDVPLNTLGRIIVSVDPAYTSVQTNKGRMPDSAGITRL
ncbi:terminase large subunit domain-containing protein [Endozoicomonas sp. ALB115]|uniref:terminase large subunit domain-containing protein n=1 Tax=Endozoicomonas sp. ALB115 TaxID=3403074 RepID=UPI003BB8041E